MRASMVRNVALLLAVSAGQLAAKTPTRKLMVWGGQVAGMIEITDQATLALSDVFNGNFLDAARGVAPVPRGLPQYTVSFYLPDDRLSLWQWLFHRPKLRRAYVVQYALDSAVHVGYVYVPGDSDVWAHWNHATIIRPAQEGHWSYASAAWAAHLESAIERAHALPAPKCPGDASALVGPSDSTYRDAQEVKAALEAGGVHVLCTFHSTLDGMVGRPTVGVLTAFGPLAVAFFASASEAHAVRLRGYVRDGVEITALRAPTSGARDWTFAESDPSDFIVRGRWLIATFGQGDLQAAIRSALENVR